MSPTAAAWDVIILGGSARAAVQSAQRAGLRAAGIDRFGDLDLVGLPGSPKQLPENLSEFAHRLWPRLLQQHAISRWAYVGGLEKHPEVVEQLAQHAMLCGNSASVLRQLQEARVLEEVLQSAGWPTAAHFDWSTAAGHRWLVLKPRASVGGQGMQLVDRQAAEARTVCERWLGEGHRVQHFVNGIEYGVNFLADGRRTRLLGAVQSYRPWLRDARSDLDSPPATAPFLYAGSRGPLDLDSSKRGKLLSLAEQLVSRIRLRGLFGLDVIDDGQNLWLLEVNPRYTASVEVLERATGESWFAEHLACGTPAAASLGHGCSGPSIGDSLSAPSCGRQIAKTIFYAPGGTDWRISEAFIEWTRRENEVGMEANTTGPLLADLPAAGSLLRGGEPVLTFFVERQGEPQSAAAATRCLKPLEAAVSRQQHLLESKFRELNQPTTNN